LKLSWRVEFHNMRQDKPYPYSIHDSFDVNQRPSKHYNGRIPANVYQNRTQIKRKEQTNMLQLGLASFNQSSLVEPNGKLAASDSDQPIVNEGTTEHISISSTSSCSASQTFSTESEVSGPSLQKSEQPKSDFRPANYKTRLCLKWEQMGECSFGDRCNFAHGRQELRHQFTSIEVSEAWRTQPQPIHTKAGSLKTRLCSKYHQFGICPYADKCKFAHGYQELASNLHCECSVGVSSPSAHQNYKTRLCMNWQDSGSCSFGDKCNFAHGHLELRGQGGGDVHGTQARPMFFCGVLGPPPLQALVPPHLACPQMCLPSMMPQLGDPF